MKKEIKDKLMGMKKSELVEIILRKDDVERKNDSSIKLLEHNNHELRILSESYKESIDDLTTEHEEYKARVEKRYTVFAIFYATIYAITVITLLCSL